MGRFKVAAMQAAFKMLVWSALSSIELLLAICMMLVAKLAEFLSTNSRILACTAGRSKNCFNSRDFCMAT